MCHQIELAVSDAVKFSSQVNHVHIFLNKLYSSYNQPKVQRELSKCVSQLDIQMLKIGGLPLVSKHLMPYGFPIPPRYSIPRSRAQTNLSIRVFPTPFKVQNSFLV